MSEGFAPDSEVDARVASPESPERAATQLSVLPTPVPAPTGVPGVDAALERLADRAELEGDAEQHLAVYEDVLDHLQAALTGPDHPDIE